MHEIAITITTTIHIISTITIIVTICITITITITNKQIEREVDSYGELNLACSSWDQNVYLLKVEVNDAYILK